MLFFIHSIINRECSEACTVGGIHIPKGMNIQVDVWSINYDPDIWGDNPEQFNPERLVYLNRIAGLLVNLRFSSG